MKMKSKFFGLSAKLALAILAVGATFASCYDSENGDVTKPYVPEKPKYVVSGYITDFVTGEPIVDAQIAGVVTATTGATGAYTVTVAAPVNGNVEISKTGYITVTRKVTMEAIGTGMASYTVDAALIKEGDLPGVKVTVVESDKNQNVFGADKNPLVDLVNNTNSPMNASLSFANLQTGSRFVDNVDTKAADPAKEAFIKYCQNQFGHAPGDSFSTTTKKFDFVIAPLSSVKSVSVVIYGVKEQYTFPFNGEDVMFTIERVVGHSFVPEILSNSHYHGHGLGHGHSGDLNAGGGIFE